MIALHNWKGYLLFFISFLCLSQVYAQTVLQNSYSDTVEQTPTENRLKSTLSYQVLYDKIGPDERIESIGYLTGDKLESTPSIFLSNGFTGRIAGLYTRQYTGAPGSNDVSLRLRGLSPLIIVDGIPRQSADIFSVNPEQIKSVTVLKDALSTAMLGLRSMNGAILITTKKGGTDKKFHIGLKAQTGIAKPLSLPDPLSAYEYASLYNEALDNMGMNPLYSAEQLQAYKNGSNPYLYPNVNWYNKILAQQAPLSRYTLNAGGSNKSVRYFVSLDYANQEGLFKDYGVNTYSTNADYQRYIFRSNVGAHLTDRLYMSLDLFGRLRLQNDPGGGTGSIMNALLTTPNNAYPVLNPDSSLGGNINYKNNIYGQLVQSGYAKSINSDGYADLQLKRDMSDILKGWWVKGILSYGVNIAQKIDRSKNFETYQMRVNPVTGDTSYHRYGNKSDQRNNSFVQSRQHSVYGALITGYTHTWEDNDLNVLLMYKLNSYTNNWTLPNKFKTLAGSVKYGIQDRYIFRAVASYSGNSRHRPEGRYGIFPAVGIAWNLHKEAFFNQAGFVNFLKLRASYGLTGRSTSANYGYGYYQYIHRYSEATGYHFGNPPSYADGVNESDLYYGVDTWEKGLKLNVGLDMHFAESRGMLNVDYYRNKLIDLVQSRGKNSGILGWGAPIYQNLGKDLYSGLEISAGWRDNLGELSYRLAGNFSLNDSKVLFNDEPDYPYPWMQRVGLPVGQPFGYIADGFITQPGGGPVREGYTAVPGDIKYEDLNKDGVINQYDRKAIGTQKPLIFYGLDVGLTWKNFHLSFLIQGVSNRDVVLMGTGYQAFKQNGRGQAYERHLNRWTPENAAASAFPRLTIGNNVNNDISSTFWLRSGNYFRLKNVEISYLFKGIAISAIKIKQLKVFVNGLNLLTSSSLKYSDPETLMGNYPIQRIINGGISLKF